MTPSKKVCFISAGEFSGDLIASELVNELKKREPDMEFIGITGPTMVKAGVKTLVPLDRLNYMGFWDILNNLLKIKYQEQKILALIDRYKPDFAILVDFPGFHFKLAPQLKRRNIYTIQYVAPKVWAWGQERAHRLRQDFDLVLGILPFETEFFNKYKVNYKFVGLPIMSRIHKITEKRSDEPVLQMQQESIIKKIACLMGSRATELKQMYPIFAKLVKELRKENENVDYRFLFPLPRNFTHERVAQIIPRQILDLFEISYNDSLDVMSRADAALITSGTAALECALLQTPLIVLYKMDRFSFYIAKKKVKIPWISLPNIILQKESVKEYVQEFKTEILTAEIQKLLFDENRRKEIAHDFSNLSSRFQGYDANQVAAEQIIKAISVFTDCRKKEVVEYGA